MTTDLEELAGWVEGLTQSDNRIDVKCEIALFEPDAEYVAIRANAAGTKVIWTDHHGLDQTGWAFDWTAERERANTAAALRARAQGERN